jgi:parallel beta-helix repeat protein
MNKRGVVSAFVVSILSATFLIVGATGPASADLVPPNLEPPFETVQHDRIIIYGDSYLQVGANGIVSGSGTSEDPFVIEGWEIQGDIEIFSTTQYVLVRSNYVHSSYYGIWLQESTNVEICGNYVTDCMSGIPIWTSSDIVVKDNVVFGNADLGGVTINDCQRVTFSGNKLYDDGLYMVGTTWDDYCSHTFTADNTVNDKPLLYYSGMDGLTISEQEVGELIVVDSKDVHISGLSISDTDVGIELAFVDGVTVSSCSVSRTWLGGINLDYDTSVVIENCVFDDNYFSPTWRYAPTMSLIACPESRYGHLLTSLSKTMSSSATLTSEESLSTVAKE